MVERSSSKLPASTVPMADGKLEPGSTHRCTSTLAPTPRATVRGSIAATLIPKPVRCLTRSSWPKPSIRLSSPCTRRAAFLYAVNEVDEFQGQPGGGVSAFRIDEASGNLSLLNAQSSGGATPCHLNVDHSGQNLLVANYGGGSLSVLPIDEDGSLVPASSVIQHEGSGVHPQRQEGPHTHSVNVPPSNNYAVACDLGLDKLLVYGFDADHGTLLSHEPPSTSIKAGSGPRHFDFHPGGEYAYANSELTSEVTAFLYHPVDGVLYGIQTVSTLPEGFEGSSFTAEMQVHPSGRFAYCSNRGHNSIAVFQIDQSTGRLTPVQHQSTEGRVPRNFGIDPSGRFLLAANQETDNVVVFPIDQKTGQLTPTGNSVTVPTPVCVKFR